MYEEGKFALELAFRIQKCSGMCVEVDAVLEAAVAILDFMKDGTIKDNPAPDPEVTDAMADAGVQELKRRGIHAPPSALMEVYRFMTRAIK